MTQNLFGDFLQRRLLTDLRGDDLFGRYRYPLRMENVPQKKSVSSVKSVGQKTSTKKNLRHLRNLRDKNNKGIFRAPAIGQRPNIRENP